MIRSPLRVRTFAMLAVAVIAWDPPCVIRTATSRTPFGVFGTNTAWPDRIYIVDAKGIIAYKGGPGPRGRPA